METVMNLVMREIDGVWYFKGAGDSARDFQNFMREKKQYYITKMKYEPTAGQMLDILLSRYPDARIVVQSKRSPGMRNEATALEAVSI